MKTCIWCNEKLVEDEQDGLDICWDCYDGMKWQCPTCNEDVPMDSGSRCDVCAADQPTDTLWLRLRGENMATECWRKHVEDKWPYPVLEA